MSAKKGATTREALIAAWHSARRTADHSGAVTLNAAAFAGFLLEAHGGSGGRARGLACVPNDDSAFFARVRWFLDGETLAGLEAIGGAS